MMKSVGQYLWAVLLLVGCCSLLQAAAMAPARAKRTLHQFHEEAAGEPEPDFVHDSQYLPEEVSSFEGHEAESSSSAFGHEGGFDIHESVHSEFHEKPVRGINHGKGAFSYSTLYASKEIE